MAAYLVFPPAHRFTDSNGDPVTVSGVTLTTGIEVFQAGTSTQTDSYPTKDDADASSNANANPLAITNGLPAQQVWLSGLADVVVKYGSETFTYLSVGDEAGTTTLPKNYIAGLDVTINSSDSDHDIDIAAGEASDDADTEDLVLASALVKQIDAVWAVGTNAGGLDETPPPDADTDYYVWLIKRTDTGVVDVLISKSASSPTLPTNYTKKRLIRKLATDSSSNIAKVLSAEPRLVADPTSGNALPRGYISGLTLSRNGATPASQIDMSEGVARDDTDSFNIKNATTITIDITASGANGLDTGAEANSTLYAVWAIGDSSGVNSTAGLLSTDFASPTFPSGYDKSVLAGAVYNTSGGDFLAFTQSGRYFRYTGDVIADVADSTITSDTFETATLSVPPSALAHVYGSLENATETGTEGRLNIRTKDAADGASFDEGWSVMASAGTFDRTGGIGMVLVDGSSQVEYTALEAAGAATVNIKTLGFWML